MGRVDSGRGCPGAAASRVGQGRARTRPWRRPPRSLRVPIPAAARFRRRGRRFSASPARRRPAGRSDFERASLAFRGITYEFIRIFRNLKSRFNDNHSKAIVTEGGGSRRRLRHRGGSRSFRQGAQDVAKGFRDVAGDGRVPTEPGCFVEIPSDSEPSERRRNVPNRMKPFVRSQGDAGFEQGFTLLWRTATRRLGTAVVRAKTDFGPNRT